jgi:hypothetical protein
VKKGYTTSLRLNNLEFEGSSTGGLCAEAENSPVSKQLYGNGSDESKLDAQAGKALLP